MVKTTYEVNVYNDDQEHIYHAYRFDLSGARKLVSRICRHFEELGYDVGGRSTHVYCGSYSESRLLSKPFDNIDVTIHNNDCALQSINDGYVFFASDGDTLHFRTIEAVRDWFKDVENASQLVLSIR